MSQLSPNMNIINKLIHNTTAYYRHIHMVFIVVNVQQQLKIHVIFKPCTGKQVNQHSAIHIKEPVN